MAIALVTVWAAIAMSFTTDWPIGFFVGTFSALAYGVGRGWAAWRRWRAAPGGHRDEGRHPLVAEEVPAPTR